MYNSFPSAESGSVHVGCCTSANLTSDLQTYCEAKQIIIYQETFFHTVYYRFNDIN